MCGYSSSSVRPILRDRGHETLMRTLCSSHRGQSEQSLEQKLRKLGEMFQRQGNYFERTTGHFSPRRRVVCVQRRWMCAGLVLLFSDPLYLIAEITAFNTANQTCESERVTFPRVFTLRPLGCSNRSPECLLKRLYGADMPLWSKAEICCLIRSLVELT